MYSDQRIQVRWNDCLSEMFDMRNGVRQGAVLSPGLFTLYIDGLFCRLQQSGIGCHVGGSFAGAFGYADDIVLLAPSLDALCYMITICETYAKEYHILFNPSKSKLMCYNLEPQDIRIQLCGHPISIVSHETYLGNYIGNDISERGITQAMCAFSQKTNHLVADFAMLDSYSLCKLHSTYCMSLYGSELWNYNSRYVEQVYVAWRKSMRKVFQFPYRAHNYIVCGITECVSIKLHRRLTKFIYSMINSNNQTVKELTSYFLSCEASTLAENYRFIMYEYDIPVFSWHRHLCDLISLVKERHVLSDMQLINIHSIKELICIRDHISDSPLSSSEVKIVLDVMCID